MSGLCHRFVNGLRARTEVKCRVKTAAGHWRYACLHREVEIPAASASVAWMQAARLRLISRNWSGANMPPM